MAVLCPEGQGHQAWDAGGVGRALPDVRMQPGLPSPKPQAWEPLGPALPWGWTSELYTLLLTEPLQQKNESLNISGFLVPK